MWIQVMTNSQTQAVALSPYLFPLVFRRHNGGLNFRWSSGFNIGDGFILRAIERRIGRFEKQNIISSRAEPSAASLRVLEQASQVVLAGANQLTDNFAPWPGFNLDFFQKSSTKFIPFGIGIDGRNVADVKLTDSAREVINKIHERISFSSWRCPQTVGFLEHEFPRLKGRFLMTGCPVTYDRPLLEAKKFHDGQDHIAVTITDRDDFMKRETATLDSLARLFPLARKTLVMHQRFQPASLLDQTPPGRALARSMSMNQVSIRDYARKLGYAIFIPRTADAAIQFYRTVDLHAGSRLHAHLLMLSQNKKTFLTHVDERATGMSRHFGFPICDPEKLDQYREFDFEIVRNNALRTFDVMQKFVDSI
jgi:hypothetical protein